MKHEKHTCPRRAENGMERDDSPFVGAGTNKDDWTVREKGGLRKCSYCGSVHPDDFIAQLRAGVKLGVTDKNYKAYLEYESTQMNKFYYQHLDAGQRNEFIDLLNAGQVRFDWPGTFTVFPYFIKILGA